MSLEPKEKSSSKEEELEEEIEYRSLSLVPALSGCYVSGINRQAL